jgi:hypothetical protein
VPSKLVIESNDTLRAQAHALNGLDFQLAFLDDKSFGEARNWKEIGLVRNWIHEYNPGFEGFIIQTPPSLARRPEFLRTCQDLGVRYVEFGVEVVNDQLLSYLRKPFRIRHLVEACELIRSLGMYVIPNLIIGVPGDDYQGTRAWLRDNVDIVPVVNVNWLSLHYGNVRGDLGLPMSGSHDRDQNSSAKSWLTAGDESAGWQAIEDFYALTDGYWAGKRTYDRR